MVHKDLIIKAQELYLNNKSINEIAVALEQHVINELFYNEEPPDRSHKTYYPNRRDIRNYIQRIQQLAKFSLEEADEIRNCLNQIHNEDDSVNILFRIDEALTPNQNVNDGENTISGSADVLRVIETFIFCFHLKNNEYFFQNSLLYYFQINFYKNITLL